MNMRPGECLRSSIAASATSSNQDLAVYLCTANLSILNVWSATLTQSGYFRVADYYRQSGSYAGHQITIPPRGVAEFFLRIQPRCCVDGYVSTHAEKVPPPLRVRAIALAGGAGLFSPTLFVHAEDDQPEDHRY